MLPINQVLQGDCTRVLRTLPNEVVDLVVTDPPYGVRYQGKKRSPEVTGRGRRDMSLLHPWPRRAAPFEKHAVAHLLERPKIVPDDFCRTPDR